MLGRDHNMSLVQPCLLALKVGVALVPNLIAESSGPPTGGVAIECSSARLANR